MKLSKDKKKLLIYLGLIFIGVLLVQKVPQASYSIIEQVIPPIKSNDNSSIFHPSSIFILIIFIIGIIGLANLERFEGKSKSLIFIVIVIVIIPLMNFTLEVTRTNYHWIKGDGLRAIEIQKSNISLAGSEDKVVVNLRLELKDYGRKNNKFKVRVYLPESLSVCTGKEVYDFENIYFTHGKRHVSIIEEDIVIEPISGSDTKQLFSSRWFREDLEYELYNDEEKIKILQPGH